MININKNEKIDKKFVGSWINAVRVKILYTSQTNLAKLIGKKPADINRYEKGYNMPPASVIFEIYKLIKLKKEQMENIDIEEF